MCFGAVAPAAGPSALGAPACGKGLRTLRLFLRGGARVFDGRWWKGDCFPRRRPPGLAFPAGERCNGGFGGGWWKGDCSPRRRPPGLAFPAGELGNVRGTRDLVRGGVSFEPCRLRGLLRAPRSTRMYWCLGWTGRALGGPRELPAPLAPPRTSAQRAHAHLPARTATVTQFPSGERQARSAAAGRAAAFPPPSITTREGRQARSAAGATAPHHTLRPLERTHTALPSHTTRSQSRSGGVRLRGLPQESLRVRARWEVDRVGRQD